MSAQVVVASVQTMMGRKDRWPKDHFGLVVVDEAHHVLSDSYQSVVSHFHNHAKILGVTATPDRGDKRNLGAYFEEIAYEVGLARLVRDGYLSRIKVKKLPVTVNRRRKKTPQISRRDYIMAIKDKRGENACFELAKNVRELWKAAK